MSLRKQIKKMSFTLITGIIVLLFFSSCGGGGGGGSDDNNSSDGSVKVTNKTGVRIINASIDSAPLGIHKDGVLLSMSKYLGDVYFNKIDENSGNIFITRAGRDTEILKSIAISPKSDTEYTFFAYGETKTDNLRFTQLEEPILRPVNGTARIRLYNGLSGQNDITASFSSFGAANGNLTAKFGGYSGELTLPSGQVTVSATTNSGKQLRQVLDLPNKGELAIVIAGNLEYGFSTIKGIIDLD